MWCVKRKLRQESDGGVTIKMYCALYDDMINDFHFVRSFLRTVNDFFIRDLKVVVQYARGKERAFEWYQISNLTNNLKKQKELKTLFVQCFNLRRYRR